MSEIDDETLQPADDESWPAIQGWIEEAGNLVELIETDDETGRATLAAFEGADDQTALGALARHAGAVLVDDWLVLLGAGGGGFPGLREFNGRGDTPVGAIPGALVVAVDRLGGGFAVNAGGLPEGELGEVCYLAPDDLEWMNCGFGHAEFVEWALDGDVEGFYEDLRWPSWREESTVLRPGQGFNVFPPLWAEEPPTQPPSRAAVPLLEAWGVVLSTSLLRGTWAPPTAG